MASSWEKGASPREIMGGSGTRPPSRDRDSSVRRLAMAVARGGTVRPPNQVARSVIAASEEAGFAYPHAPGLGEYGPGGPDA